MIYMLVTTLSVAKKFRFSPRVFAETGLKRAAHQTQYSTTHVHSTVFMQKIHIAHRTQEG
jgi:hypothetical protein